MPAATKKKRTWAGLVCPVCRFVFRIPKDHDGAGVICPACHYLLNIPTSDAKRKVAPAPRVVKDAPTTLVPSPRTQKESKPIVSRPLSVEDALPAKDANVSTDSASRGQKRVRRKKRPSNKSTPDWDNLSSNSNAQDVENNPLLWILGGALLGLSVVGIGVWLVIDSIGGENSSDETVTQMPHETMSIPERIPEEQMNPEEKRRQQEISDTVTTGMTVLSDAEIIVRKFLEAESLAELEGLVRTKDVTVPRMKEWYANKPWVPPGVRDIGFGGRVTVRGKVASMAVKLNDFSVREIALENTADGYKVDWESWVGWTSVAWEDLFEKRPTEPVEVRVNCSRDSYYNRLFNDDSKWIAVKMHHISSDRAIYGYIDRDSLFLMRMIGELRNRRNAAVTIKISYPKDSVANNQVYITEYIQNGWVRPAKEDPETE